MRILSCLLLLCGTIFAEDLPLLGLAHAGFRVGDLEKARAFYHGVLGYDEAFDMKAPDGQVSIAFFKINDDQFIEIFPGIPPEQKVMMTHIAMYTDDIEKLHKMMEERGAAAGKINHGKDGNLSFAIRNPPGQNLAFLEFVQYLPESLHRRAAGKFLSERRISTHLEHAGLISTDFEVARRFYVDQLGFKVLGDYKKDGRTTSLQLRLPGPTGDYLEMGNPPSPPTGRWIGVVAHIALSVPDIKAAYQQIIDRGVAENQKPPLFGADERWQLNVYDPDGTRSEFMQPRAKPAN